LSTSFYLFFLCFWHRFEHMILLRWTSINLVGVSPYWNAWCNCYCSYLESSRSCVRSSGQTKDYAISICCFSAKHVALRSKSTGRLAQNQDNVSEWSDLSTCGLLFQWTSYVKMQLGMSVGLIQMYFISFLSKSNLFLTRY
jgi:hypothetical protein